MVMTPPSDSSAPGSPGLQPPTQGVPRAEFYARPNSHPFQNRVLLFSGADLQIKIGRSVARSKPSQNNGIFDCKVLSRNHALIWYDNGKFYLQDTKSSNGTFVNNQRLSKGSEESPAREVCSGDILQFGVDVVENSRKVTHGCIIATLKLYLPDGKEAKASPTIVSSISASSLPAEDMFQLYHYIQEALVREQMLENKLSVLQSLVGQTESASSDAWKSLIDEDRLLTRVEILESQLSTYAKGASEDKLREEAIRLMEEKEHYQETAKDTLKKLVDEKLETVKRMSDVERALTNSEDEYTMMKDMYEREVEENSKLAEEITRLNSELEERRSKDEAGEASECPEGSPPQSCLAEMANGATVTDDSNADGVTSASEDDSETVIFLKARINSLSMELLEVRRLFDEANNMTQSYREDLNDTQDKLREAIELLDRKDQVIDELESKTHSHDTALKMEPLSSETPSEQSNMNELESLREQIEALRDIANQYENMKSEKDKSSEIVNEVSRLEEALSNSNDKIADLLKVKEKYAELLNEKQNQTMTITELEEQVETLSFQSRLTTFAAVVPMVVLCLAICIAYLPIFSAIFGTSDIV